MSRRFQTDSLQSWVGLSALVQVRQGSTNLRVGSNVVLHLRNEVVVKTIGHKSTWM